MAVVAGTHRRHAKVLALAKTASGRGADAQPGVTKPGDAFLPTRHARASGTTSGKCAGLACWQAEKPPGSLESNAQTPEKASQTVKERMSRQAQVENRKIIQLVLTQALSFLLSKVESLRNVF